MTHIYELVSAMHQIVYLKMLSPSNTPNFTFAIPGDLGYLRLQQRNFFAEGSNNSCVSACWPGGDKLSIFALLYEQICSVSKHLIWQFSTEPLKLYSFTVVANG